jgi:histone-lysine N-methyltransferase SETMAR
MDFEQRVIIRFLSKEGVDANRIHTRLSAQFRDEAYSLRSVQRWCQYVRQGRELMDDEPRAGRPPIDFLDIQILSNLEKYPFHSAYSLAEILKVSHATILKHLHDALGMKHFHLRWIPHQLTEQLRAERVKKCRDLLPLLERMEASNFHNIVTGDESWFNLELQQSAKWSTSREDVPQRVRQHIGTKKFMLTVIWGVDGFHVVDLMTSQRSFDSQYFVDNIMVPLVEKVYPEGWNPHAPRLHLHLDNCRVHFSKVTEQFVSQNHISRVAQPAYSPDLAPSDFWLFGHLKTSLAGRMFDEPGELLDGIRSFLEEVRPSELQIVFSHWVERVRWVLGNNGDYYHE